MTKNFTMFFLVGMIFFSCKKEKINYTIGQKEMIEILVDVHLAEAALQNHYGEEKDSLSEVLYNDLFSYNKIDSLEFRSNLNKLKRDPKKLQEIYTEVVEQLSVKESGSVGRKKPKKK